MQIVNASAPLMEQFADEIPALVHATGPTSYDYYFDQRAVFDSLVRASWVTPGTLFSADATRLALDGDRLLGIEIGFHGPEFKQRSAALGGVWTGLLAAGSVTEADIAGVMERADHAGWLNPVVRDGIYYVHALSVKPESRGQRVGLRLFEQALATGRNLGHRALELDVLSDNPAVHFYQSQGLQLLVESRAPIPQAHGVPPEWRMGIALQA